MSAPRSDQLERVRRALQDGDAQAAFRVLEPLSPVLTEDRELAVLWLTLLRTSPHRPQLQSEAGRALERWPHDPELVLLACDALIGQAERLPSDAPQPVEGAAALASRAARRCLDGAQDLDATVGAYLQVALANALRLRREFEPAREAFERALSVDPERGAWWFNLGLLHKAEGAFREGLEANKRARARLGDEKRVLWNLAICALAAGESEEAAEALSALGHRVERTAGGLPFVPDLPPLQVRVATVGSGLGPSQPMPHQAVGFELLWVTPLSPCHGVVSSASYRVASVDYGDIVLWDGVPVGVAEYEGRPVPRFPLLAVLHKGDERRFRFVALQQEQGDVEALGGELPDEARLFVHSQRVEHLCPRCASGEHAAGHRHLPAEAHHLVYGKIVIAGQVDLAEFRARLEALLRRHDRVQLVMPELLEAVGDSAAAGKAHQLWRGLERRAEQRGAGK